MIIAAALFIVAALLLGAGLKALDRKWTQKIDRDAALRACKNSTSDFESWEQEFGTSAEFTS